MNRSRIIAVRLIPLPQSSNSIQVGDGGSGGGNNHFKGFAFQRGYGQRFRGFAFQRGHGHISLMSRSFGQRGGAFNWGIFAKLFGKVVPYLSKGIKSATPLVKSAGKQLLKSVGDQAVNSSTQFLNDVISGSNVLDSAKQRLKEGGSKLVDVVNNQLVDEGIKLASNIKRTIADNYQQDQKGKGKRRKIDESNATTSKIICRSGVGGARRCFKNSKLAYKSIFDL
jgi:hypothetical protein